MLAWLRQLAQRVRLTPIEPDSTEGPRDPHSYVRHPLGQRPGGRHSGVALEEPDDDPSLSLIGHR